MSALKCKKRNVNSFAAKCCLIVSKVKLIVISSTGTRTSFNPLSPKSDKHLISPYIIRTKCLDVYANSPN